MTPAQKLFWDNRPPVASQALHDVMTERYRQMMVEGWTAKHDDEHGNGAMAVAAACYALASEPPMQLAKVNFAELWKWTGWAQQWWKPKDKRRNLIRAAALLLAEIERMDRAEAKRWKPCAGCTTPGYCTNQLRGCDRSESAEAGIEPIGGVGVAPHQTFSHPHGGLSE